MLLGEQHTRVGRSGVESGLAGETLGWRPGRYRLAMNSPSQAGDEMVRTGDRVLLARQHTVQVHQPRSNLTSGHAVPRHLR